MYVKNYIILDGKNIIQYLFDNVQIKEYIKLGFARGKTFVNRLKKLFNPVSIIRNDFHFPKTITLAKDLENPHVRVIEYYATVDEYDIEQIVKKIGDHRLVDKYPSSKFIQLIAAIIFSNNFEPGPKIFDNIILYCYGLPVVIFKNKSLTKETYSMSINVDNLEREMLSKVKNIIEDIIR